MKALAAAQRRVWGGEERGDGDPLGAEAAQGPTVGDKVSNVKFVNTVTIRGYAHIYTDD